MKVIYLDVRTFVGSGVVEWAKHYWGTLVPEGVLLGVELTHKLSVLQARNKNAEEVEAGKRTGWEVDPEDDPIWSAGDEVTFFWTRKAVVSAAKRAWKKHYPDADVLLDACPGHADPCEVIDAKDPAIKERLAAIYAKAKTVGFWDEGNDKEMQAACDEWEAALEGAP